MLPLWVSFGCYVNHLQVMTVLHILTCQLNVVSLMSKHNRTLFAQPHVVAQPHASTQSYVCMNASIRVVWAAKCLHPNKRNYTGRETGRVCHYLVSSCYIFSITTGSNVRELVVHRPNSLCPSQVQWFSDNTNTASLIPGIHEFVTTLLVRPVKSRNF